MSREILEDVGRCSEAGIPEMGADRPGWVGEVAAATEPMKGCFGEGRFGGKSFPEIFEGA